MTETIPIDAIVELDRLNMADFIRALGGTFDPGRRRRCLHEEIERGARFILARRGGTLAGYIEYRMQERQTLNIASIQVHPQFRNGPTLRRLLSAACDRLRKNPPRKVSTSVYVNNSLSKKLNSRLGLKEVGRDGERICFQADGEEFMKHLARFVKK